MPKPFDTAIRFLQTIEPASWVRFLGSKATNVTVCNTDFSTVTSTADFLLLLTLDGVVGEHIESQATYDPKMGDRTVLYNVLARKQQGVPIHSTVLLLRPEADGPAMTGLLQQFGRNGALNLEFRFDVIRIWTIPAEELFKCGLGVLPFAFIGAINVDALPDLVRRTQEKLNREAEPKRAAEIWTAITLLMGLRFNDDFVAGLLKGVRAMRESTTYQAILEEGKQIGREEGKEIGREEATLEGARRMLREFATVKFGEPSPAEIAKLQAIQSLERLLRLPARIAITSNWNDLLS